MRLVTLALLILLGMSMTAQKQKDLYNTFLRVYDHSGKKIAKGKPSNITHNTLHLRNGQKGMSVNYKAIGTIRSKRSVGHAVIMSTVIGVTSSAIFGAVVTEPDKILSFDSKGQGALYAGIISIPVGAGIGAIGGLVKKKETFYINGDLEAWKQFLTRFPGTNPNGLLSMVEE